MPTITHETTHDYVSSGLPTGTAAQVLEALCAALLPSTCGAERRRWAPREERTCYLCDAALPCPCDL